jgi:phosphatidylglycerol:prolipoprotein diacylglycerol transferase
MNLLAIAFPALDPVALHLGPVSVRWYGLAYVVGFIGAWLVIRNLNERWRVGLTLDDQLTIVLGSVIGVLLGGRLGYVLFYNLGHYVAHPLGIFAVWDGGMSFHGGLVGIVVAGLIIARIVKVPFWTLADIVAVGVPIGLFLGRLANFVNAELWGRVTTLPWGVVFPDAGTLPRHPSQIYEAVLEGLVLLAILWVLSRKARPQGFLFGVLLTGYGVARIFVEFFREPDVQVGFLAGGITMGQLLTLPVLAFGLWMLWWSTRPGRPMDGPPPGRVADKNPRTADATTRQRLGG